MSHYTIPMTPRKKTDVRGKLTILLKQPCLIKYETAQQIKINRNYVSNWLPVYCTKHLYKNKLFLFKTKNLVKNFITKFHDWYFFFASIHLWSFLHSNNYFILIFRNDVRLIWISFCLLYSRMYFFPTMGKLIQINSLF